MSDWRTAREYRVWRAQVIMRDKRCVICGSIHGRHAHHVNHATYFVDQRFDVDNGVTLCSRCHMNYHCNFNRSYRTKCDEYNFMNFVHLSTYFNGLWVAEYTNEEHKYDYYHDLTQYEFAVCHVLEAYNKSPDNAMGFVTELKALRTA